MGLSRGEEPEHGANLLRGPPGPVRSRAIGIALFPVTAVMEQRVGDGLPHRIVTTAPAARKGPKGILVFRPAPDTAMAPIRPARRAQRR